MVPPSEPGEFGASAPAWWKRGVIYHIYPRSFQDSNGDGVGDLEGIRRRLDHLEWLGVDALWLSPIYPSPGVDFGYDVADYRAIDPVYGTMDDFRRLLDDCHRRGLRVILDIVINHTSEYHPWFLESRWSRDSPKRDWYLWHDGPKPPNNWGSAFGGSAWTYDPRTDACYMHSFLPSQPDLNWRNPEVQDALMDMLRFWLDLGVDGFRLDVFNAYVKDAELLSNPRRFSLLGVLVRYFGQHHLRDRDQPEMDAILSRMRRLVDSYPGDRCLIGETLDERFIYDNAQHYYLRGRGLHLVFNFRLLHSRWSRRAFERAIRSWLQAVPEGCWPTWVVSNHDFPRERSHYRDQAFERSKLIALILTTLKGTPFIYYGQEIGMLEEKIPRDEIRDPLGLRYWPFVRGRDGCRTPMQWKSQPGAGFTQTAPWMRVGKNVLECNVEGQMRDPGSLLCCYRDLLALRRAIPAIEIGGIRMLERPPLLSWRRFHDTGDVDVIVNMSPSPRTCDLPPGTAAVDVLYSTRIERRGGETPGRRLWLAAYEGIVVRLI